ncbi:GNAT family N-acetyltransferase [Listeria innocua]|nr:GNAT family N-acetyltransferase [Enterococcus faecalis]EHJ4857772.1 GNAT family N-acetyltransferase [Listeria monocytogenes]EKA7731360.1 GNAT family N-acetyltransferase [Listeria innocua]EKA7756747.1 GNAT family N-acetyltransferase [Listeria innocua]EKA7762864.1 GNAT family N-acetyltransferase [Listeria innocua]EKA7765981.1 GNAT family N-acetyltransferase [Listeria innocua]
MKYYYEHILPNGVHVIIRSANPNDAIELHHLFNKTHSETDFLTTYPDESHFDLEKEMDSYQKLNDSENSCEILAVIDNKIIGSASLNSVSLKDKEKHRGVIGLSILKEYYGLGIGNILFSTIIE